MNSSLPTIKVTDIDDSELTLYCTMRENMQTRDNVFVADTEKVVVRLLQSRVVLKSILADSEFYQKYEDIIRNAGIPLLYLAEKDIMSKIVGYPLHHGVMCMGVRPFQSSFSELGKRIVLLDGTSRLDNVGVIIRTMAGFGVTSLVYHENTPHPWARRIIRVSMGSVTKVNYHKSNNIIDTISKLKQNGYTVYAAETFGECIFVHGVEPSEKWVLVMGNEGQGISGPVIKACDTILKIPMTDSIPSFNTSAACAVILNQLTKNSIQDIIIRGETDINL
jgi:tRNA G18 (ribose-2'-O)-methylase SpoU